MKYSDDDDDDAESSTSMTDYSASEAEDSEDIVDDSDDGERKEYDQNDLVNDNAENSSVENQIEGDFDRLIGSIRSEDVASTSMLSRIWDAPLPKDEEDTFHDDLRGASGIGRRKKKGVPRKGPPLSHQVRALIGEGNHAYVEGNIPEAIRIMTEVIRIEPRAMTAWSVLATCHKDINEPLKALQLSIIGAHLKHDADEWYHLAIQSREMGYSQQALYCYGKAVSLDPSNVNAYWDRATLAKALGELRTARRAYLAILKHFPHNIDVLTELRQILVEFGELKLCATLFQEAYDYYTKAYPLGQSQGQLNPSSTLNNNIDPDLRDGTAEASSLQSPASMSPFGLVELLVLADLYNTLSQYHRSINIIRAGVRWLQGRAKQHIWDKCVDDREYDMEGFIREGENGAGAMEAEGESMKQGFYPLDINARHRLAVARLKLGHVEEGKIHADIILSQSVLEFAPLFAELADAYFEREQYDQARPIYEMLGADAGTSSMYVLEQVAACRRNLGDLKEAAEVYEYIIATDPSSNDARMKLAEIYEITNQPRKALALVYQVIDSRKRRNRAGDEEQETETSSPTRTRANASLFAEKRRSKGKQTSNKSSQNRQRLSKEELMQLEQQKENEALRAYARVKQLWEGMLNGEEVAEKEWLIEAEKLVEMFRETRALFTVQNTVTASSLYRLRRLRENQEAEQDSMASRLQLELGQEALPQKAKGKQHADSFRGIHFDDWMALMMQYSFLLTRRDQFLIAEEVLRHMLVSSAYQTRIAQDKLRLALITCALHARKHATVLEQCRKLMFTHQFNNEPLRILLASLSCGLNQTDQFVSSTLQKYLLRELRMYTAAAKGKQLVWNSALRRYGPSASDKSVGQEGEEEGEREEEEGDAEGNAVPQNAQKEDIGERFAAVNKPMKDNPVIVTVYAQACTTVRSYQSALFYLLAAFDYCPVDPMICLSLGIASIGRAMQRQADNRHYLIAQGMGFLTKYRDLRLKESADYEDEVEFNFGRAFNQLGLMTHAVKHYERVLEIAEKRMKESGEKTNNVAKEAAYNLSLIYVTTGATPLAQDLYKRWLSL